MRMSFHHGQRGITSLDVLVVIATVVLLAVAFGPLWLRTRSKPRPRINCVSNLKQVSLAFRLWADDNGDKFPWQLPPESGGVQAKPFSSLAARTVAVASNELNSPKILVCPEDRQRIRATNWSLRNTNLSYFIGQSADDSNPATLLAGDRNLLADGRPLIPGRHDLRRFKKLSLDPNPHGGNGNIGLSDGSVQESTSASFNRLLQTAIASGQTNVLIATP